MSTFLFNEIIFGPVISRRLGVSLGINLMPADSKFCNFNCVYCECGWTKNIGKPALPPRKMVKEQLERKLQEMEAAFQLPDVITYAGNGEPTIHPEFIGIIDDSIELRNKYCPDSKIAVLSNATQVHRAEIRAALQKIDQCILKLDSGIEETIKKMNQPIGAYSMEKIIANFKEFNGNLIVQTMFVRGKVDGIEIDNTTHEEIVAWANAIREISPKQVMVYTISRDTPTDGLERIDIEELERISDNIRKLGIDVQVSG
jgi:wyosine [tRNA(Phe)-imidazoG37] synthetase (radical SAM superfamily)